MRHSRISARCPGVPPPQAERELRPHRLGAVDRNFFRDEAAATDPTGRGGVHCDEHSGKAFVNGSFSQSLTGARGHS